MFDRPVSESPLKDPTIAAKLSEERDFTDGTLSGCAKSLTGVVWCILEVIGEGSSRAQAPQP